MTFDVLCDIPIGTKYSWQHWYEVFCLCRNCRRSTVFVLSQRSEYRQKDFSNERPSHLTDSFNTYFSVETFVSQKGLGAVTPPSVRERTHHR
jgi:hypothetical protein